MRKSSNTETQRYYDSVDHQSLLLQVASTKGSFVAKYLTCHAKHKQIEASKEDRAVSKSTITPASVA